MREAFQVLGHQEQALAGYLKKGGGSSIHGGAEDAGCGKYKECGSFSHDLGGSENSRGTKKGTEEPPKAHL